MQPVIEVLCPFCKARGQIVTPPVGSIIVGPCPRCNELVLLFCGAVLPLDKEIILKASPEEKKAHLTDTIMELVINRIDELVDNAEARLEQDDVDALVESYSDDTSDDEAEDEEESTSEDIEVEAAAPSVAVDHPTHPISDQEVQDFLNIDLPLIDRKEHFERVFGRH